MTIVVNGQKTPLETLPFEFQKKAGVGVGLLRVAESLVPAETVYSHEHGDYGPVIFAIQNGLNQVRKNKIAEDWSYGDQTEAAVTGYQERPNSGLDVDGQFGQATSRALAADLYPRITSVTIPSGLLRGLVEGESGGLIGALNNSVVGGRDVSYCQRRIYEADYGNREVVKRAYRPKYQMDLFAQRLRGRKDVYLNRYGSPYVVTNEWAWRLGTLYHNYPYAADKIASVGPGGLSSYFYAPQAWVQAIGAKMDDGTPVQTPLGWCKYYSLGAPEYSHKGRMVEYVTQWIA